MPISRRLLSNAMATRALGVTNATGYVGQVGAMNGLPGNDDTTPADPPTKGAGDLRVQPYFILFSAVGVPGSELDLGDSLVDLDWPIQITAAGGDIDDVLALVDRIHNLFWRWTPAAADGVICGPLRVPDGWNPGVLTDRQFTPHRFYVPLRYQLTAHT